MSPIHAWACFNRRTITRTASQSRLLSLGSCISADVTVLSRRTTLPSSIFSRRALASSPRLIASQVSARIALLVLCSTDFFGLQGHGSRAKARNDAESSRWKASSSQARNTAARLWLQAGQRRPGHAQHYLGHKNIQHTVRYTTGCLRPAEKRLTAFRRWRAAHPEPARYEPPGSGHEAEGGRSSRP